MAKVGFDNLLPNFRGVRVGAEHPFTMFLYDETQGNDHDWNVLPSITLTDSAEDETLDTLGIGYESEQIGPQYLGELLSSLFNPSDNTGYLVTSPLNVTNLQNAVNAGNVLQATRRWMTQRHTIDIDIWAENKNVTSLLFDLVNTCFLDIMDQLHLVGIDFIGISGRRSGDFNLDFGRLLWGSSLTFNAFIRVGMIEVDLNTVYLKNIDVNPTFEVAT